MAKESGSTNMTTPTTTSDACSGKVSVMSLLIVGYHEINKGGWSATNEDMNGSRDSEPLNISTREIRSAYISKNAVRPLSTREREIYFLAKGSRHRNI